MKRFVGNLMHVAVLTFGLLVMVLISPLIGVYCLCRWMREAYEMTYKNWDGR